MQRFSWTGRAAWGGALKRTMPGLLTADKRKLKEWKIIHCEVIT
jgi:hypothetical protein